ncbi:cyd operon protein YbgE [Vibrio sp. JC009]|uniref:cyd operon protein YbgE n=1 Tax=Vibrio sp. JC009 TaxID=2912314 RepID=UPI0023B041ED|nr:cyd operon protein YbgE [Vibrio sp. JC009]WED22770.1 cyd operon protein YbgE [Vibrio sp. JC009]
MKEIKNYIKHMHKPVEKTFFRALSLLLAFAHAGLVLWDPVQYASAIGGFNALIAPLLIWAVCSGVIFGIGFTPNSWFWRVFFSPYFSLLILFYLTLAYILG